MEKIVFALPAPFLKKKGGGAPTKLKLRYRDPSPPLAFCVKCLWSIKYTKLAVFHCKSVHRSASHCQWKLTETRCQKLSSRLNFISQKLTMFYCNWKKCPNIYSPIYWVDNVRSNRKKNAVLLSHSQCASSATVNMTSRANSRPVQFTLRRDRDWGWSPLDVFHLSMTLLYYSLVQKLTFSRLFWLLQDPLLWIFDKGDMNWRRTAETESKNCSEESSFYFCGKRSLPEFSWPERS